MKFKLFEEFANEMAIADVNAQKILKTFDSAHNAEKERIFYIVVGKKGHDRTRLIKELTDIGYKDIRIFVNEIGIDESVINEALHYSEIFSEIKKKWKNSTIDDLGAGHFFVEIFNAKKGKLRMELIYRDQDNDGYRFSWNEKKTRSSAALTAKDSKEFIEELTKLISITERL